LHALAAAVALCTSLAQHGAAQALTLGRIELQSALGEPLRAEIDLPQITPEEAASLRVGLASADIHRAAGMPLNPALINLQIRLERRAQGGAVLVLSTPNRLNEPFIELIVEAQWAAGRMLRDYSVSLDTSKSATSAAAPSLLAATTPAPLAGVPAPAEPTRAQPPAASEPADTAAGRTPPSPPVAPQANATAEAGPVQRIRIQYGDTASKIAAVHRPAQVSLDQMLVAMLRGNPAAFVDGNVNRMKAGALIDIPTSSDAQAIAPEEARQIIAAQSRDFNEFRRRLAAEVPVAAVEPNDRQSSGQVQGEVKEVRSTGAPVDKLMLSKGAVAAKDAEEALIAQQRQANDAAAQVAELTRNIEELAKLSAAAPGGSAPAEAPQGQGQPAALGGPELATQLPASAPAEQARAESSLIASLTKEPLVLPVATGLLALLAGMGFLVSRRRRPHKREHLDSSLLHSRQVPDAFFETGRSQPIPAGQAPGAVASMAVGAGTLDLQDVDPLAEADVYLAYGRDMQAEEILREALAGSTQHLPIVQKLLEIHAKRRDTEGFAALAQDARELTQGEGPPWAQICEMGRALDATNPLYRTDGRAGGEASSTTDIGCDLDLDLNAGAPRPPAPSTDAVDFDFEFPPEMTARIAASAQPQSPPPALDKEADEPLSDDDDMGEPPAANSPPPMHGAQGLPPNINWGVLNLDIGLPAKEEPRPSTGDDAPLDKAR
jgi:pilus assembly protein FimV